MIKSHNLSRKANETPHHVVRLIGHQPRISVRRGGSRTAATSKMEHFVIIVNGWKPLTIITKLHLGYCSSLRSASVSLGSSITFSWVYLLSYPESLVVKLLDFAEYKEYQMQP